jgi:hypothetical protein
MKSAVKDHMIFVLHHIQQTLITLPTFGYSSAPPFKAEVMICKVDPPCPEPNPRTKIYFGNRCLQHLKTGVMKPPNICIYQTILLSYFVCSISTQHKSFLADPEPREGTLKRALFPNIQIVLVKRSVNSNP